MKRRLFRLALVFIFAVALMTGLAAQPHFASAKKGAGKNATKIERDLRVQLKTNPDGEFPVIVQSILPKSRRDRKSVSGIANVPIAKLNATRAHQVLERIKSIGGKDMNSLAMIGASSATMNAGAIRKLSRDPFVKRISLDREMTPMGNGSLSLAAQVVRANQVWAQGFDGAGISIAVIDSGVSAVNDLMLPTSRLVASVDFTSSSTAGDPGGHGTHVAGIVAGNGNDSGQDRKGVAPGANIVNIRVIRSDGRTSLSTVVRGMQWAVKNRTRYNIRVINLSLGGATRQGYTNDPLAAAVEMAWFSGITVITAAGNSGPFPGTVVTPGIDPYVITVGATDDAGTVGLTDDSIPWFSSQGPTPDGLTKPDVVAPGRQVVSLRAGGSFLDNLFPDRRTSTSYFRLTGTSMAAPVVAGTAALMLQRSPDLRPDQVKHILKTTARPYPGINARAQGAGLIDAYAATNSNSQARANVGLTPAESFAESVYPMLYGMPLNGIWRDPNKNGIDWNNITWDNIAWDNITWDNIAWESITWDSTAEWSNITWDNITWDNITWDSHDTSGNSNSVAWDTVGELD